MPYIKKSHRRTVDSHINKLISVVSSIEKEDHAGVVNYIIFRLLKEIFSEQGYRRLNEASGVLTNVSLEFYRRIIAVYEDAKIHINGDIV